jgi:xylan 1,4-beta-xylosidase
VHDSVHPFVLTGVDKRWEPLSVELSFMPTALASGSKTVFHYRGNVTPPKDYQQWSMLIHSLVGHWVDRYGIREVAEWFFEVWNEPNLTAFWTG